jgi:glutamate dehydrogenase
VYNALMMYDQNNQIDEPMTSHILMNEVYKLVLDRVKKEQAPKLEKFLKGFFNKQGHGDIKALSPKIVADLAWEAWEQFGQRLPNECKVQIYELKLPGKSGGTRIVINALNNNMPFLVDSLLGYLSRFDLRARILLRPMFQVQRDEAGYLQSILGASASEENMQQESLIHCEITDPCTPELLKTLREGIPNVFRDVRLGYEGWEGIRNAVQKAIRTIKPIPKVLKHDQVTECVEFLEWLDNHHFTFLGYREYALKEKDGTYLLEPLHRTALGLLSDAANYDLGLFHKGEPLTAETMRFIFQSSPLVVSKTERLSTVHRPVPLDSIALKIYDDQGKIVGLRQFLGLFTSVAYSSSTRDIPLLRSKVFRVVEKAGFSPLWHDGKALTHILDSLPRDELFQASEDELLAIGTKVLSIQEQPRIALFIRKDHFDRYLSCLVYVPRDRFEYSLNERIGQILEESLKSPVDLVSATYGSLNFARIHYMVKNGKKGKFDFDADEIEKKLVKATYSWKDSILFELIEKHGEWEGTRYFQKYANSFNKGYQERFTPQEAIIDIQYIEEAYKSGNLGVRIYRDDKAPEESLKIKLYNIGSAIALSDVIPTLEDMDLRVLSENPFSILPDRAAVSIWIHDFETTSLGDCAIDIPAVEGKFLELFHRVHIGQAEKDGFNRLVIRAGLNWQECVMMRSYCKYLRQLHIQFSQEYMEQTLVRNPTITRLIRDLFVTKFNIANDNNGQKKLDGILEKIHSALDRVENIDEDRILRRYTNLVNATVRTNYYQISSKGNCKPYLSFKFDALLIDEMPAPRPKYEIFIYSPRFEAVHLRGGKIARGGIRWSDRREDFRTEILGLLKAQMVKNAVIVPQGAKGGFILKTPVINMTREEFMAEGIECYKQMMRALLELTDNLVKGATVHPENTKCLDESDPYLVVAADKGTATFSDTANQIAEEKAFWLGDAFASGGSQGYDHKQMGITARGAWESVKRHFWELGIDVNATETTVIGVGDMAGDVFGNGMLMSNKLKLIAAFNHRHIFIDPNPNPAASFKERQRMFDNRLGWDGYNPKVLSTGGMIAERKSKSIKLNAQVKKLFGLTVNTITPSELIRVIFKSQVDLLWLGGIGTFVKSRYENHSDVGDRTNDDIRVNGSELRCKVVGEGANLGVTQKARIEFAHAGGAINTDAIDNSAGVDCSDHEVNIKILLRDVMSHGSLNIADRNKLLVSMTDDVSQLVLRTNIEQNLALSLMCGQGAKLFDSFVHLMRILEKAGQLDRILESLPDDSTLAEYQALQIPFSRPELSVLMPYAKNILYSMMIETDLPDEPKLIQNLASYFPTQLQKKFKPYISNHPLKREIIATMLINTVVNRMGASFVHDLNEKTGRSYEDIFRAYLTALEIYGLDDIWREIDKLGSKIQAANQVSAYVRVLNLIRRVTIWLLRNTTTPLSISEVVKLFKASVDELYTRLDSCIVPEIKIRMEKDLEEYEKLGLPSTLAKRLSRLEVVASSPDIVQIANESRAPIVDVAGLYFAVGARFGFSRLRSMANALASNSAWQRMAVNAVIEDLYVYQGLLTKEIHDYALMNHEAPFNKGMDAVEFWVEDHHQHVIVVDQLLTDASTQGVPDLALLTVIQRELRLMCE